MGSPRTSLICDIVRLGLHLDSKFVSKSEFKTKRINVCIKSCHIHSCAAKTKFQIEKRALNNGVISIEAIKGNVSSEASRYHFNIVVNRDSSTLLKIKGCLRGAEPVAEEDIRCYVADGYDVVQNVPRKT